MTNTTTFQQMHLHFSGTFCLPRQAISFVCGTFWLPRYSESELISRYEQGTYSFLCRHVKGAFNFTHHLLQFKCWISLAGTLAVIRLFGCLEALEPTASAV